MYRLKSSCFFHRSHRASIFYLFISLDYNYHVCVLSSTSLSITVYARLFDIIFAIIHLSIGIYISNFTVHNGTRWHFASTLPIYLYCHASARGGSMTRDTRNYSWTNVDFRGLAADIDIGNSMGKSMQIPNNKIRGDTITSPRSPRFHEKTDRSIRRTCNVRGHHSRIDCSNIP